MNAWVSLSPFPRAHPPRSNPFLRSSSDAWPSPCITPSMVTLVMVVSFMIAIPLPAATPRGRPYPCHEHHRPDPTPPPGFLGRTLQTPVVSDPIARQFRG